MSAQCILTICIPHHLPSTSPSSPTHPSPSITHPLIVLLVQQSSPISTVHMHTGGVWAHQWREQPTSGHIIKEE